MEYRTITKQYGNCKAIIHMPILTDNERERRMAEIKKEAMKLLIEAEKVKQ
jgi:hypothetical protein